MTGTAPTERVQPAEPALKYTKLAGLVKKSLTEFKVAFETNFPGHDMVKVLEAAPKDCRLLF